MLVVLTLQVERSTKVEFVAHSLLATESGAKGPCVHVFRIRGVLLAFCINCVSGPLVVPQLCEAHTEQVPCLGLCLCSMWLLALCIGTF